MGFPVSCHIELCFLRRPQFCVLFLFFRVVHHVAWSNPPVSDTSLSLSFSPLPCPFLPAFSSEAPLVVVHRSPSHAFATAMKSYLCAVLFLSRVQSVHHASQCCQGPNDGVPFTVQLFCLSDLHVVTVASSLLYVFSGH